MRGPDSVSNVMVIEYAAYKAGFMSTSFVRAHDMSDFGPRVEGRDPLLRDPLPPGRPKPVRYAPVPRRHGEEVFPELTIELTLVERGNNKAVSPPAWQGARVDIEVVNLWDRQNPRSLKLEGTLEDLRCRLKISQDTVKDWLDPQKPLGARINENLLDVFFTIPAIEVNGKPFAVQSSNRLYFYRRKILVFFPGVFGSQVQITAPEGQVLGYPDFFDEDLALPLTPKGISEVADDAGAGGAAAVLGVAAAGGVAGAVGASKISKELGIKEGSKLSKAVTIAGAVGVAGAAGYAGAQLTSAMRQKIGVLECDQDGEPLAKPKRVELFSLGGIIYDVLDDLRDAKRKHFQLLPRDFKLMRLFIAPYDWRLDLTKTSQEKLAWLEKLQAGMFGREARDSDDELAVIGHSTGGLLIRRILAEPAAESLISHAFFINVPFRGAAKTLSVIPTGRDPLDGGSMIPFVHPDSLRAIALCAPVVYHLSATSTYPQPVFVTSTVAGQRADYKGLEAEKKWVQLAIDKGFMPSCKAVPGDAPLTREQRHELALGADDWNKYWNERWKRLRDRSLIRLAIPELADDWELKELVARGLLAQNQARVEMSWSDALAEKARAFHEVCEEMAGGGKWKDKSYIFYSITDAPTTLAVRARQVSCESYINPTHLLKDPRLSVKALLDRDDLKPSIEEVKTEAQPPEPGKEHGLVEEGAWMVTSFARQGLELIREQWRFSTLRQIDGDGTVPLSSLIGFGGEAKVFKKITTKPGGIGPGHVDAPKADWVWARIVEVLQGIEKEEHFDKSVDTARGIDNDGDLHRLRRDYYRRSSGPPSESWTPRRSPYR